MTPFTATTAEASALDAAALELGDELEDWLKLVGFALEDLADGSAYFDVLRNDF